MPSDAVFPRPPSGGARNRRRVPEAVDSLEGANVLSLAGTIGIVAIATNAETGDEELYTWGRTPIYVSENQEDHLMVPHRFELG